ncbi:hypothetical protein [Neoroseomonas soli]|nr:hypothetical protein [Neoroseomonas soli]
MKPNGLYFVLGVLVAAAIGAGVWIYKDRQRGGIDISIGGGGVRIEQR